MKLIERTEYLDTLKRVKGTPDIKVITGIRRSGKSKLLDSFAGWVKKNDKKANVIKINYNLTKYEKLLNYSALEEYVEQSYVLVGLRQSQSPPNGKEYDVKAATLLL